MRHGLPLVKSGLDDGWGGADIINSSN